MDSLNIKFIESINFLKKSLIYQMSLGSKELFHSNVWAYLLENDIEFLKVFLPDFEFDEYKKDGFQVFREKANRDIIIYLENRSGSKTHITIENKIKSLPHIEQLEDYTKYVDGRAFQKGILTGICDNIIDFSSSEKLKDKWIYVNYEAISERIRRIAANSKSETIQQNLYIINEYCDILNAINSSLNHYLILSRGKLDYSCEKLYALRIADVYKKLKGSNFISFVNKYRNEIESYSPKNYELRINSGFYNCKATLTIRFCNYKDKNAKCSVMMGVQLEGDQFRIVAQKDTFDQAKVKADDLYELFKDSWFDDSYNSKEKNRKIFGFDTTMKATKGRKYDSYQTSWYCFIYQYFDINESNNSYEKLLELIKYFMKKSAGILDKLNSESEI